MSFIALFYEPGVASSRPSAASGNTNYGYFATDTGVLSFSTGSAWLDVSAAVPTLAAVLGVSADAGGIDITNLGGGATTAWLPTSDEKDALDSANSPASGNPFATIADLSGGLPSWFQFAAGSPLPADQNVTPSQVGALYQDITNGGLYEALGATAADWFGVGGDIPGLNDGTAAGTGFNGSGTKLRLIGNTQVLIADVAAQAGTGNGLVWNATGGDGAQTLQLILGSSGQFFWEWDDAGVFTLGGDVDATTLPLSAGASGTLYVDALGYVKRA